MKFISKVTIISCVCCYFGGLWFIASRFGLAKLLSRYGLSQAFNEIPKNFPQIKYLYLQPIITQYFIDNKSEIWLLFLIAHSKR